MRKATGIVFLTLGLLFGPGYYVYTRFFSGELVATQPLSLARDATGRRFDPVPLDLAPDMQPVALVLRFSASHGAVIRPPDTPRNDYRVRLLDGERVVLEQRLSLHSSLAEATPGQQFQHALPLLNVDRPASYHLELWSEGEPQMQVYSADVQVRAHARVPDLKWVGAGAALAVLGFLALVW